MAEYERVSSLIYSICIRYVAPCDIHVYSIDESFIDCTPYLHFYREEAEKTGTHPARVMAMTIIRDILKTTKITATVGIGTNLYLAKVAMDIVAKKAPPDADGVRIAELNEDSYKYLLWDHTPLTDFWMLGPGKAKRLQKAYLFTMGDVAARSQYDMEWFYKTFGIDGEILVDHAWGVERVTMADIKSYHTDHHSLSNGQVLPRPYHCGEARNVLHEMIDALAYDMYKKKLAAQSFTWWVSYDHKSLQKVPDYTGPVVTDDYGRLHPEHDNGSVKTRIPTNSPDMIASAILRQFDTLVDDRLLFRRLGVCANGVQNDDGVYQLDMFTDYGAVEREKRIQAALMEVRKKYGPNALLKGNNFMEGATMRETEIQTRLNRKLRNEGKETWSIERLRLALNNEAYRGDILTNKFVVLDYLAKKIVKNRGQVEQCYIEGHHPPIVCGRYRSMDPYLRIPLHGRWDMGSRTGRGKDYQACL